MFPFSVILSQGSHICDSVFTEATITISKLTSEKLVKKGTLYPSFDEIRGISARIALTTTREISKEQDKPDFSLDQVKLRMWKPNYNKINRIK